MSKIMFWKFKTIFLPSIIKRHTFFFNIKITDRFSSEYYLKMNCPYMIHILQLLFFLCTKYLKNCILEIINSIKKIYIPSYIFFFFYILVTHSILCSWSNHQNSEIEYNQILHPLLNTYARSSNKQKKKLKIKINENSKENI